MTEQQPVFNNPVPERGPRVISSYDGPGYSQEPGQINPTVRPIYGWVGRIPVEALYRMPPCRRR